VARTSTRIVPEFTIDAERACEAGKLLLQAFNTRGIFGHTVTPQHRPPQKADTLEHRLRFVTQTVALDYLRDSHRLYDAGRATFDDESTRWLYTPEVVECAKFKDVAAALKKHGLAQRESKDTEIWVQVAQKIVDHFKGSVHELLALGDHNAPTVLSLARNAGLPSLSGPKVGSLWMRMLNDSCIPLTGLEQIPIPVDRHVMNVSLALGAVTVKGLDKELLELPDVTPPVQEVWFRAAELGGFKALDLDAATWWLGKLGCSKSEPCLVRKECPVQRLCLRWKGIT
jgi:hypothetical protein